MKSKVLHFYAKWKVKAFLLGKFTFFKSIFFPTLNYCFKQAKLKPGKPEFTLNPITGQWPTN